YGPLACHHVLPDHAAELQRNLIYHLASGVGQPLSVPQTRAVMASRASSLARGFSGIGDAAFDLLLDCLNRDVVPVVPEMGTVGASGDLTPLAHIALVLIGEGEAVVGGTRLPGDAALAAVGLSPVSLEHKEGLALVNGTSAMTGISCLNGVGARSATNFALRLALLYAELVRAPAEAFDPRFGVARPHPGQRAVHRSLASLAEGSRRLDAVVQPPPFLELEREAQDGVLTNRELPQAPYTARCLPQIFGAVLDLLDFHDRLIVTELRSATDNPLVFADDDAVLHGGNFYGQHVAFAADTLQMAIIKLALHAERCLARICDPLMSNGLPAFLQAGPIGRNSGFMGAQVTATALVAELRLQALPASIQSIPTNNNNQDVVTMGTIGARRTARSLDLTWHILAIHAIALAQAFEIEGGFGGGGAGFGPASSRLCSWIRKNVGFLDRDRPLSGDVTKLAALLPREDWAIQVIG
ncbi:MAG: HAL/PAL/TAL family ammonia-lyase, partial [Janthinobacterium lividum]